MMLKKPITLKFYNYEISHKKMDKIDFKSSAQQGDIVEIGIEVVKFGNASLTLKCEVRNKMTRKTIIIVDKIIMVSLDQDGNAKPHGKTKVEFVKDRLNDDEY
jgi:acyl-CoA hydrolase